MAPSTRMTTGVKQQVLPACDNGQLKNMRNKSGSNTYPFRSGSDPSRRCETLLRPSHDRHADSDSESRKDELTESNIRTECKGSNVNRTLNLRGQFMPQSATF